MRRELGDEGGKSVENLLTKLAQAFPVVEIDAGDGQEPGGGAFIIEQAGIGHDRRGTDLMSQVRGTPAGVKRSQLQCQVAIFGNGNARIDKDRRRYVIGGNGKGDIRSQLMQGQARDLQAARPYGLFQHLTQNQACAVITAQAISVRDDQNHRVIPPDS